MKNRWFAFRHGWLWFHVTRHFTAEAIAWRLAWLLPRKVALLAFVRVYAASGDSPGPEYIRAHDVWASGVGK